MTWGSTEYRVYKQEGTGQVYRLNTDQEYNAHTVKNSDKAAAKKQSWTVLWPTTQRSYALISPNYTTATNETNEPAGRPRPGQEKPFWFSSYWCYGPRCCKGLYIFVRWDVIENRKGILTGGCSFEEGNSIRQGQRFWSRGRAASKTVCCSHEKVLIGPSWTLQQ